MGMFDKTMEELRKIAADAQHAAMDENGNPITGEKYRAKVMEAAKAAGCTDSRQIAAFVLGVKMGRMSQVIDMEATISAAAAQMLTFTLDALK